MLGRFDEARSLLAELRREANELQGLSLAWLAGLAADIELLAGNPASAIAFGEEQREMREDSGERAWRPGAAGRLAEAFYELRRLEDADAWARRARELLGETDDVFWQIQWRRVTAKVLARRGEFIEAERLADEAVAISERTDLINAQGDALRDLAEVLAMAGRRDEAAIAFEQALDRYERKENLAMVAQVRPRLKALRACVT